MSNPEGTPIWYELMTTDVAASKAFYEEVIGWKIGSPQPGDEKGYRMLETPHGYVGGVLPLSQQMCAGGAKPTWLFYLGVKDVDATIEKVKAAGGKVQMGPFDVPNVGRIAMIADPQGIPLYVMRAASDQTSTAFDRNGMGRCNWNELATPDQASANAFYEKVFGWNYTDKMALPGGGEYVFAEVGGTPIGATMPQAPGSPRGWQFYFRTPDIDAAKDRVEKAGGKVHAGPMEVPGGDRVIIASDVHGAMFGVVAPGKVAGQS
jgi:predicted enzyme related to lactoylglutathione lyase